MLLSPYMEATLDRKRGRLQNVWYLAVHGRSLDSAVETHRTGETGRCWIVPRMQTQLHFFQD